MDGGRGSLQRRIALAVVAVLLAANAQAGEQPRCRPAAIGAASVRAVVDGRTVSLQDGREVRLAGIEVPHRGHGDAAARAGKTALEALLAGRDISLLRLGPERDRYGRLSALVLIAPAAVPEGRNSVQLALLAQGFARVAARVGDAACAAGFFAAERAARAAGLGLWSDTRYVVKKAENADHILAERGRFALVEGRVLSVRESGATIYVNFGRRWTEDFTVTTPKRNQRRFAESGLELKQLAGRHVRVRGTIEERGGPWIEAMHPEQIEVVERE